MFLTHHQIPAYCQSNEQMNELLSDGIRSNAVRVRRCEMLGMDTAKRNVLQEDRMTFFIVVIDQARSAFYQ